MSCRHGLLTTVCCALVGVFAGCVGVPPSVENDPSLEHVELGGYRFHVQTFGYAHLPPVIVVHGGPGGDSGYLHSMQGLLKTHHVIFYDQRGTGLSPRVDKHTLTLESIPGPYWRPAFAEKRGPLLSGGCAPAKVLFLMSFSRDLTLGAAAYKEKLLMLSSECSFIGYKYQQAFHMPSMPTQTLHVQALAMGHSMLTLNPVWSLAVIAEFFGGAASADR